VVKKSVTMITKTIHENKGDRSNKMYSRQRGHKKSRNVGGSGRNFDNISDVYMLQMTQVP